MRRHPGVQARTGGPRRPCRPDLRPGLRRRTGAPPGRRRMSDTDSRARVSAFREALATRVVVADGAMGTMLQAQ
ncbi:hypothetical protein, partial [Streptomyces sp. NPDC002343]